ncbi:hypothetical protein [Caballeronia sp. LjRoot31]|uniref:hypothetical protein n=1 Tax=Caballeronia sp. LjRoot31 TaxID=3342324 RepID=UPI003ED0B6CA
MTQRSLKTTIADRPVTVQMGWDARLQYHFMVIDFDDSDDDEPLYSNLSDESAGLAGQLKYFAKKARSFGIEIPQAMLAKLQTDEALNLGNATSTFDAAGIERQE